MSPSSTTQIPPSSHVFLIILENTGYSTMTNSFDPVNYMPWLVGLGTTNGHAINYITNSGGSLLAYLWLSSGYCHSDPTSTADCPKSPPPNLNLHFFGCTGGSCINPITDDNIYREMVANNISWTLYFESLPSVGWMGGRVGNYDHHHNPAKWYSDVIDSASLQQNMVPFTQFATDLANSQLPRYALIIPDDTHDAHDGTPRAADDWLKANVGPLLNQPFFQPGGDGLLIITFDNGDQDGASQVYTALIGPKVKPGSISNTLFHHEDALLTILQALGLAARPGYTAVATGMGEFFIQPAPAVTLSTRSLGFSVQAVGVSTTGVVTLTNSGDAPLAIASIGITAGATDYSQANNCGGSLAAGASCTDTITFKPSGLGARTGTLTFTDSVSPAQTVQLSGTGINPQLVVTKPGSGKGTVTSSDNSINCGSTCSATFNSGARVTLKAAPASGSILAGWVGACSGAQTCVVTMNGSQTVSAVFTQTFNLTVTKPGAGTGSVTSNDGSINCGSACFTTLNNGVTVTLAATPAAGSIFSGWGGACSGTQTCVVMMNSTQTVSAVFTPAFNLIVTRAGAGAGTVTSSDGSIQCGAICSEVLISGSTAKLTATAAFGSTFAGWSGACSGTQTCTLMMDAAQTTTATFNRIPSGALLFVPVTPCRVADTRMSNGPFGGPFLSGKATRGFTIPAGACNIPATAQAYSLNATVVPHGTLGYLTVFPCGEPQPLVSTLNSMDGRIKGVGAIVPAGANGAACFFATDDTELVLDINGYFVSATTSAALAFYPVTPCRMVDTRLATGALGGPALRGNTARTFPLLTSPCNVPAAAQAYSLNYTSVPKGHLGFLTTWAAKQPQPLVSTLNAPTGAITANATIVSAGANGAVSVFATDDSDLVIDVNGYFAPPSSGGSAFYTLPPCRVLDTRNPAGSQPLSGTLNVNVGTSGCGAPASAQAYVFNATVVPPGQLSFLTLWPQGAAQPLVSTLNAVDGAVTSNMGIVPTTNGSVNAFALDQSHLVLDISGYFAPTASLPTSLRTGNLGTIPHHDDMSVAPDVVFRVTPVSATSTCDSTLPEDATISAAPFPSDLLLFDKTLSQALINTIANCGPDDL